MDDLAARIDAELPQTQCTRCGYADCRAYAGAIAVGGAAINRCPPGGAEGIARLAALTGGEPLALDPACGAERPRLLAAIDEDSCIGCRLCLKACPVDAIVGGPKSMHVVIAPECTGCELCVPVCPVDCIALARPDANATGWAAWSEAQADGARARYEAHRARLDRDAVERAERLGALGRPDPPPRNDAGALPAAPLPAAVTAGPAATPLATLEAAATVTANSTPAEAARALVAAALARARARSGDGA